jgi:hypothetical protein
MALNSGTGRSEVTDEKQTKGKIRMKKGMDTRSAASGRGKEELGRWSSENVQHGRPGPHDFFHFRKICRQQTDITSRHCNEVARWTRQLTCIRIKVLNGPFDLPP